MASGNGGGVVWISAGGDIFGSAVEGVWTGRGMLNRDVGRPVGWMESWRQRRG